jgi:glycosyltransferase involved in cell wall biosynthesis
LTGRGSDVLFLSRRSLSFPNRFALWALRRADAVTGVSQAILHSVELLIGGVRQRCFHTPNGIDISFWSTDRHPSAKLQIVAVGSLRKVKGHDLLIDALVRVCGRHTHVRCIIIGEGPERKALEEQTKANGLGLNVSLVGWCSPEYVRCVFRVSSIYVMPSRSEGLPSAVLEAMAAGVPVIVSDVGGLGALVRDGETGLTIPADDSGALADAIERYIQSPDLAVKCATNASRYVQRFSLERMAESYIQSYHAVLED